MKKQSGYTSIPFSMNRRMVTASATVGRETNNIHGILEVDVTVPRQMIREHKQRTGEGLSFTAYIITCLAQAIAWHPRLNAFRKGGRMILLEDVTISCQVEREMDGESYPEPIGIRAAQSKTYRQIHDEIRAAQQLRMGEMGGLSGMKWVRFIPGFLMRSFFKIASGMIGMNVKYGVIGVTAVGMYARGALWFIPLSAASVAITVGSIVERPVLTGGTLENHEHLCLTASFNHDIVDGSPAARFLMSFSELLQSGELLSEALAS